MTRILAGFSGVPVKASVGVRAVIIRDTTTGAYEVVSGHHCFARYSFEEVDGYHQASLLTLVNSDEALFDGAKALYAHMEFISPPLVEGRSPLVLNPEGLRLECCRAWVGFTTLGAAYRILDHWARQLLDAAHAALDGIPSKALAKLEAERALRAVAGNEHAPALQLRNAALDVLREVER